MPFLGQFPYGTDGGQDLDPDESGTVVAQGIGRGCNFALITDAPHITLPIPAATVLQRIYGTVPITGLLNTVGATNVTIIVNKNGVAVDSSTTTLNFDPSPDNSITLVDASGVVSLSLNYPAAGGTNGSQYQPARSDHIHTMQAPLVARSTRDEVASGQISVTSTTGETILTASFALPNDGLNYLLVARSAGVCFSNTNNIWIGVAINGTDAYYSGNIQAGPELREAEAWTGPVVGAGQTVTANCRAKCDNASATNLVGSAKIFLMGLPYPFTH